MNTRWQRIEELFNAARELDPEERKAYLERNCADEDLRQELESLLAKDRIVESPIDGAAWDGASSLLESGPDLLLTAGASLGPYNITGVLGAGGMGYVYQANDSRLGRSVYIDDPRGVGHARFSPDGHWVAYTVGSRDTQDIYVSPFPMPNGQQERWAISNGGGYQPLWARDGKEILYVSPDGKVMSVEVSVDSSGLRSGTPQPLFPVRIAGGPPAAPTHRWDVTRDGERFLVTTVLDVTQSPPITIVTNWESALKP
jgi:hypothetical protein